jgi:hypothetical protein
MTLTSNVVYPHGLAKLKLGSRTVVLTTVRIGETYGDVAEGAPRPEWDEMRRQAYLAELEACWGERATLVRAPEVVEVRAHGQVMHRMPGFVCAAWLTSDPVAGMGAGSELVLVWWTEALDVPIDQLVERALAGVEWNRVARDFDY